MFGPLISVLAVILGLVLVGPISPANADSGTCDVSGGYVKPLNGAASGSVTDQPWGTVTWGGTTLHYVVNSGYTIGFCHKAGTTVTETTKTGPAEGDVVTPNSGPQGQQQDISHIGYKVISEPTVTEIPKDATAAVNITPATCSTGETATEGATSHASWVAHLPVTGPGSYSFTANADTDHQFADGSASKTYTDSLHGPNTSLCDPKDATATVDIDPANCDTGETATEGATSHASWVAHAPVSGPGNYSFTANADEGHQFSDGSDSSTLTGHLDGPDKSLCHDGGHDPKGNNGSIKVDDDGLPGCNVGHSQGSEVCDNGVGNDPHLGCSFYVEWYNYEALATSTVTFEVQYPTGGTVTAVQGRVAPDTVTLDDDDASGANEAGFDGFELYQLTFSDAPQPNQGWHVTVTAVTTDSLGNSETKSKTFWVEGDCYEPPCTEECGPNVTPTPVLVAGTDECGILDDVAPSISPSEGPFEVVDTGSSFIITPDENYYFEGVEGSLTLPYTPNTGSADDDCDGTDVASAGVDLDTTRTCDTGQSASPGEVENAHWQEDYSTVHGPDPYTFVAVANDDAAFPAGDGVSKDGATKTFSGTLLGSDSSLCTPEKPNPVKLTETVEGCNLTAFGLEPGTGHRDGTEDYALVDGKWVLDPTSIVWGSYVQDTTLSAEEIAADCDQPGPLTRTVHSEESGCALGGVHTWDEVYTTPYVWDAESQTWVLGDEQGPVAENDVLTPYTAQQAEALGCVEVEGEQTHGHHGGGKHHPEVKGEQAHAPAAALVPTQVEAGLAGTPAGVPAGGSSNNLPLWALSLGAGMFLVGAGRLRRTSRATR